MSKAFNYVFGPVPSRRLGYSLGVDIVPMKYCDLNCIYCELGRTTRETLSRRPYIPASAVLPEIRKALHVFDHIDYITFTGSGEPTLNTELGAMIRAVKALTGIPVAVLTNGTLFYLPEVRQDVRAADVVIPSLDAVSEPVFRKINRPHGRLRIDTIIEGLKQFRKEYSGQIWLEILLVQGVNDTDAEIRRLRQVANEINPDKIQLNTVVRPPAESGIRPVARERLEAIRNQFGEKAEIIAVFHAGPQQAHDVAAADLVLALISRRPVTLDEICASLGLEEPLIRTTLKELLDRGEITEKVHENRLYYFAHPRHNLGTDPSSPKS